MERCCTIAFTKRGTAEEHRRDGRKDVDDRKNPDRRRRRVSKFTIVKPSGNVVMDESVAAIAKRVTQMDPCGDLAQKNYYEGKNRFRAERGKITTGFFQEQRRGAFQTACFRSAFVNRRFLGFESTSKAAPAIFPRVFDLIHRALARRFVGT